MGDFLTSFSFSFLCPRECSKCLLRACCCFCSAGVAHGAGSGLLLRECCCVSSFLLDALRHHTQVLQGRVGTSTFPRDEAMLSEAEELQVQGLFAQIGLIPKPGLPEM